MSRREIREQIFKVLFRVDFFDGEELKEQMELIEEDMVEVSDADKTYIKEKAEAIYHKIGEIDAAINEKADKWKTTRMAKAELTILRLAVYEMNYEDDIPVSVAINEAVELAKKYGAENGAKFVNGVLAKMAK